MLTVKNKVNSRLNQKLVTEPDAPYHDVTPKLNFTSTLQGNQTAFPTLYVKSIGEPSTADDLDGNTQCAIISTIQIRAYTNTNVADAFTLIDRAGDVMLSMGYIVIGDSPQDISDSTANVVTATFRRVVASGDLLY